MTLQGAIPRAGGQGLRGALLIALVATVLRIAYLVWLCPYSLVEDEATGAEGAR